MSLILIAICQDIHRSWIDSKNRNDYGIIDSVCGKLGQRAVTLLYTKGNAKGALKEHTMSELIEKVCATWISLPNYKILQFSEFQKNIQT